MHFVNLFSKLIAKYTIHVHVAFFPVCYVATLTWSSYVFVHTKKGCCVQMYMYIPHRLLYYYQQDQCYM